MPDKCDTEIELQDDKCSSERAEIEKIISAGLIAAVKAATGVNFSAAQLTIIAIRILTSRRLASAHRRNLGTANIEVDYELKDVSPEDAETATTKLNELTSDASKAATFSTNLIAAANNYVATNNVNITFDMTNATVTPKMATARDANPATSGSMGIMKMNQLAVFVSLIATGMVGLLM
jgi:hypothetical protein